MLFDTSIILNIEDSIKNYIINKLNNIYTKSNIKFKFLKHRVDSKNFDYK